MPLTETKATTEQAVKAFLDHGTYEAAAIAIGCSRTLVRKKVARIADPAKAPGSEGFQASVAAWAAERGLTGTDPVMPGFSIRRTTQQTDADGVVQKEWVTQAKAPGARFEVPAGHVVKGVSSLVDAEGRTTQTWIKTREGVDPLDVVADIKAAFEDYAPRARPVPAPASFAEDLVTLLPLADWHIGMHSWGKETGTDWDLKIAEEVIGRAVENVIERSPASGLGIVLGGGDLMHADNQDNRTSKSGNQLDVDGRYPKVFDVAARLTVRTIDAALRRHGRVLVRILKGNHDEHCSVAIAHFFYAWYRNEPRVTVDLDPSLFWWFRFGRVMLGATHGHETKITDMPAVMAHRRAEDWGLSRFRFVLHHTAKFATEGRGVISEIHRSPIPQDAWHFGAGFLSGRSLQTITYHRSYGEISRAQEAILDAAPEGTA